MTRVQAIRAIHVGRAILASLFFLGGVNKMIDPAAALAQVEAGGLPFPTLVLWMVIGLELGGGAWVASGLRGTGLIALVLAGYTMLVNLVFHPFWAVPPEMFATELSLFFKNVSIAGGLIAISGVSAPRRMT